MSLLGLFGKISGRFDEYCSLISKCRPWATTPYDIGATPPMADWRDKILSEFTPGVGKTIAVADPDRLLTDPRLNEAFSASAFALVFYQHPVAFRVIYE